MMKEVCSISMKEGQEANRSSVVIFLRLSDEIHRLDHFNHAFLSATSGCASTCSLNLNGMIAQCHDSSVLLLTMILLVCEILRIAVAAKDICLWGKVRI